MGSEGCGRRLDEIEREGSLGSSWEFEWRDERVRHELLWQRHLAVHHNPLILS